MKNTISSFSAAILLASIISSLAFAAKPKASVNLTPAVSVGSTDATIRTFQDGAVECVILSYIGPVGMQNTIQCSSKVDIDLSKLPVSAVISEMPLHIVRQVVNGTKLCYVLSPHRLASMSCLD